MRDTTKEITGKLVSQICRKGYMIMMVKNKLLFGKHKGRSVEIDKTPGKQTRNYERVTVDIDDRKRQIFNEDMIRTKSDLLSDIDYLLSTTGNEAKENPKHSRGYYDRYIDLIKRFRARVDADIFPEGLEDWWHYEYTVSETGIALMLNHERLVGINKDGRIGILSTDTSFELITISTLMLTVEQYAKANEVTTTAVRQGLRIGAIHAAVKHGDEWRIPELAEITSWDYKYREYKWANHLSGLPTEYRFINDYNMVSIWKNDNRKDLFKVAFVKRGLPCKVCEMNQREREAFELMLASNPLVSPVPSTIVHRR